ncbi:MAG: carboxyltransferase domain-containing protein, partial [Firmicutes bacterium]|nr:carboxyltransferase domain-containing protein [Bacillota bacterium]
MNTINIVPAGDRALSVQLEQVIEGNVNDKVHGLMTAVQAAGMEGIEELIPTYCSLLVLYDPLKITYDRLRARLTELYENASAAEKKPSR